MMRSKTLVFFCYALLFTLFTPIFFPAIRITFFAPFLIVMMQKKSKIFFLWQAFLCGLIMDLLQAGAPIGLIAFSYILTLLILSQFKSFFFEDRAFTLPTLSVFFAQISTLIHLTLYNTFCHKMPLGLKYFVTDLLILPFCDGIYALLIFTIPLYYLSKILPTERKASSSYILKKAGKDR